MINDITKEMTHTKEEREWVKLRRRVKEQEKEFLINWYNMLLLVSFSLFLYQNVSLFDNDLFDRLAPASAGIEYKIDSLDCFLCESWYPSLEQNKILKMQVQTNLIVYLEY